MVSSIYSSFKNWLSPFISSGLASSVGDFTPVCSYFLIYRSFNSLVKVYTWIRSCLYWLSFYLSDSVNTYFCYFVFLMLFFICSIFFVSSSLIALDNCISSFMTLNYS